MEHLLRGLDPFVVVLIVFPLALFGASWALQMACSICSARVPDPGPAAATVIVCIVANLGIRMTLNANDLSLGLGSQILLALLTSSLILSFSIRTSISSALAITVTQVFLSGVMYYGLNEVCNTVL